MAGRNSVSYIKPAEPAFIKRIKEKVGFKEGPTIETKKETLAVDDGDGQEIDDEKPVVVVLKPGDLSQEEADSILEKLQDDEKSGDEVDAESEAKITFKKPVKRSLSDEATVSTSTTASSSTKKMKSPPVRKPSLEGDKKQVKNRSLLSFDDEENDD